jgi:glycosyltransferase involved in cell wall biosynthesis
MRILLLNDRIPPENRGGAGEVFWRLAGGLQQAGHEVHVITATADSSFEDVRDDIPVYHLHSRYRDRFRAYLSLYNPQTAGALKRLYERINPEVINAHNIHADLSYYSLTLAHRLKIPAVFSSHDVMPFAYFKASYCVNPTVSGVASPDAYRLPPFYNLKKMRFRYNPLRNVVIRHVLRQHAQARTAPSNELCRAHAANALPPFETVYNGIDTAQVSAAPEVVEALRARLNLQGRKVILFAGRLTGDKGTVPLLKALAEVVKTVPEAALLVLSSHPIEAQVQQREFASLRQNHLVSGGWLSGEELAGAYHLASVAAVPSIVFDTFPTVNLEAMAAGKAVLATCYGGSREVVQDGVTGYIINPFDTADFAAKLARLLSDDALCTQMGLAGQARVQTDFSLARQVENMLAVYRKVTVESY